MTRNGDELHPYLVQVDAAGDVEGENYLGVYLFTREDLAARLIFGLSIVAAVIVPLIWAAICLPLTYWFGFRSAQTVGLICIFPMIYVIKFFEDGPGLTALPNTMASYFIVAFVICVVLFILSYLLSVTGYSRKK